jgi:hypothetical protein
VLVVALVVANWLNACGAAESDAAAAADTSMIFLRLFIL